MRHNRNCPNSNYAQWHVLYLTIRQNSRCTLPICRIETEYGKVNIFPYLHHWQRANLSVKIALREPMTKALVMKQKYTSANNGTNPTILHSQWRMIGWSIITLLVKKKIIICQSNDALFACAVGSMLARVKVSPFTAILVWKNTWILCRFFTPKTNAPSPPPPSCLLQTNVLQ